MFFIELVRNDFEKNGLQINQYQHNLIKTLELMNDKVDKRIEKSANLFK